MTRSEILDEAKRCVTKDRNATHGEPENNFRTIAELWNIYLKRRKHPTRLKGEDVFDEKDVAILMILVKLSRLCTSPECADHWVDTAGYAACGGEIATPPNEIVGSVGTMHTKPKSIVKRLCPRCGREYVNVTGQFKCVCDTWI